MVIKGILDPEDARDAVRFGADGTVVSNAWQAAAGWRAFIYALATHGQRGVENLLNLIEKEMRVAMTLTGAKSISEITRELLVQAEAVLSPQSHPPRPRAVS